MLKFKRGGILTGKVRAKKPYLTRNLVNFWNIQEIERSAIGEMRLLSTVNN